MNIFQCDASVVDSLHYLCHLQQMEPSVFHILQKLCEELAFH